MSKIIFEKFQSQWNSTYEFNVPNVISLPILNFRSNKYALGEIYCKGFRRL